MDIHFTVSHRDTPRLGQLFYVATDRALDFRAEGTDELYECTVLVRDVSIEFNLSTKEAVTLWGYHPHPMWEPATLRVPPSVPGNLLLLAEWIELFEVVRLPGSEAWPTRYDKETGWLCFGDPRPEDGDSVVEFLTDVLAVLQQHSLKAIWLKPLMSS